MKDKKGAELTGQVLYVYLLHCAISLTIPLVCTVLFSLENFHQLFYSAYLVRPLALVYIDGSYLLVIFCVIFRLVSIVPQMYMFRKLNPVLHIVVTIIFQLLISFLGFVLSVIAY